MNLPFIQSFPFRFSRPLHSLHSTNFFLRSSYLPHSSFQPYIPSIWSLLIAKQSTSHSDSTNTTSLVMDNSTSCYLFRTKHLSTSSSEEIPFWPRDVHLEAELPSMDAPLLQSNIAGYPTGDSPYTTVRTYENRSSIAFLSSHVNRLNQTYELLVQESQKIQQTSQDSNSVSTKIHHPRLNLDFIKNLLSKVVRMTPAHPSHTELRIRITIPLHNNESSMKSSTVWVTVQPFTPIDELTALQQSESKHGIAVKVWDEMVRDNPQAKNQSFIEESKKARVLYLGKTFPIADQQLHAPQQVSLEIKEVIMMHHETSKLYEGLSSNFFIIKDNVMYTAADDQVLPGITRTAVLHVARIAAPHMEIIMQAPSLEQSMHADELFISSTSRGIWPVVILEGQPVGNPVHRAQPGPLTKLLQEKLIWWTQQNLIPLK